VVVSCSDESRDRLLALLGEWGLPLSISTSKNQETFVQAADQAQLALVYEEVSSPSVLWDLGYLYCSGIPVFYFSPTGCQDPVVPSSVLCYTDKDDEFRVMLERYLLVADKPATVEYVKAVKAMQLEFRCHGPVI
jgi:hypothetical protein